MEPRRYPRLTKKRRRGTPPLVFASPALAAALLAAVALAGGDDKGEGTMRIEMRTEGGIAHFPGLARPTVIDVGALPPADGESLRALVAAALSAPPPPSALEGADYRTTFLVIDEDGVRRELKITDLDGDPARRALIEGLRRLKRAQR